jgi:hypothetical protein
MYVQYILHVCHIPYILGVLNYRVNYCTISFRVPQRGITPLTVSFHSVYKRVLDTNIRWRVVY